MDELCEMAKTMFVISMCIIGVIFIGFWSVMGCGWIISGYEHTAWNELYGTHYTQMQWFSGSDFIKKYHYPDRDKTTKEEFNVNVNS